MIYQDLLAYKKGFEVAMEIFWSFKIVSKRRNLFTYWPN